MALSERWELFPSPSDVPQDFPGPSCYKVWRSFKWGLSSGSQLQIRVDGGSIFGLQPTSCTKHSSRYWVWSNNLGPRDPVLQSDVTPSGCPEPNKATPLPRLSVEKQKSFRRKCLPRGPQIYDWGGSITEAVLDRDRECWERMWACPYCLGAADGVRSSHAAWGAETK